MELDNTHRNCTKFFQIIGFVFFIIWFINVWKDYQTFPISSKISFKFGDNGEKLLKFPLLSLCKLPIYSYLWKNVSPCR